MCPTQYWRQFTPTSIKRTKSGDGSVLLALLFLNVKQSTKVDAPSDSSAFKCELSHRNLTESSDKEHKLSNVEISSRREWRYFPAFSYSLLLKLDTTYTCRWPGNPVHSLFTLFWTFDLLLSGDKSKWRGQALGTTEWILHRKRKETKQQPSMLPGPAVPGCCLASFHFQCYILLCRLRELAPAARVSQDDAT